MFPANGANVKIGKGALFLDMIDDVTGLYRGEEFLGNAPSISITPTTTKIELFSSTEASGGLVASDRTSLKFAVAASLSEVRMNNLALFLLGKRVVANQVAGTLVAATFTGVRLGSYYPLGARKVSAVTGLNTAVPLVENVDYRINSEYGVVYLLPTATAVADGDDISFTFTKAVQNVERILIGAAGSQIGRMTYRADDANSHAVGSKDVCVFWKVEVTPNGELGLVTTDYASFGLSIDVLSDAENHPGDDQYGYWDRLSA